MTSISLEHVSVVYDPIEITDQPIQAVNDVSLKLEDGDVLVILGPSGCGKSTLLRILAGLIAPTSGTVLYDQVPLDRVPREDRGIGMVFQEGALMPHWEARRSVGFFMWLRRRESEVPERVQRISAITGFGMDALLDRRPAQLSGGEKQRVSIARALTRDLNVLLCDEPFANIDAKLRTQARIELKRLLNEFPVTTVYVTHDQVEAMALSKRVAVMRAGKVEQVGPYQLLYENPVNLFVATFVGVQSINLFHGYVRDSEWYGDNFGGYAIRRDLEEGTRVIMAVRPEHIRLADDGVPAKVHDVTPYFAERYQLIEVRANGEQWTLHVPPDVQIGPGETVHCQLNEEAILYFDSNTEKRIG